ncbi:MAG: hypothetical protein IVW52_04910 [Acidimicrobiales bacterium]|nr:hypothetical protein [Acidimicrobiales bacterium]
MTETRLQEIGRLRGEKHKLEAVARDGAAIIRRLVRHHENPWDCDGSFNRCDDLNAEASEFVGAHGQPILAPRPSKRSRSGGRTGGA